jgi:hypothetical protein
VKLAFAVVAFAVSSVAHSAASPQGCESSGGQAAGCTNTTITPTISPTITPTISPTISPTVSPSATAEGGQGGSASSNATGGSAQGGNAQGGTSSVNVTMQGSGPSTIRTVGVAPDVVTNTTANCRIAVGVSGGVLGGALGFSGSVLDEGCDINRLSAHFMTLGMHEESVLVMCDHPRARKVMGAKCPPLETSAAPETIKP